MTTLLDLLDPVVVLPRRLSPAEKFQAFNELNPKVLEALEEMCVQMVARGRKRIGIGCLFEVLRWNYYLKTDDPNSDLRLNNDYRSRFARLILLRHPDWEGLFELRAMHD